MRNPFKGKRAGIATMPVGLFAAGAIAIGFGGSGDNDGNAHAAATSGQGEARPVVVTRSDGSFRANCTPRRIGHRLHNLTRAVRTIDATVLRHNWKWPRFNWFLVSRGNKRIFSTDDYRAGLRKLRRRGGRLRLRMSEVEVSPPFGSVIFEGTFRSKSGRKRPLQGKAGLGCRKPRLIQMAVLVGRRVNQVQCPAPSEPAPKRAMIVCTRERE